MIRFLYMKARYGSYLQNEYGIKKFAEMSMGQFIHKATKKSAFYREMNENLLVEKANLHLRLEELLENPTLVAGEFFSVRRRLGADMILMSTVLLAAIAINYYSAMAFITEASVGMEALRWILSVVLAMGGFLLSERFVEALFPVHQRNKRDKEARKLIAVLWIVLLAGIEMAMLGLASVQASVLALTGKSGALYYGFMATSMLLPLVAGAFRWDAMQWIDIFKTTQSVRQIESRLAQIDSVLRQNEEYESNYYKVKSLASWDRLNEFRTIKENYNARKGYAEHLGNHFAQTYDLFEVESNKRYEASIRSLTQASHEQQEDAQARGRSLRRKAEATRLDRLMVEGDGMGRKELEISITPQPIG